MLTSTRLQRLWRAGRYRALVRELACGRPEARLELDERLGAASPTAAAALGLLRFVELNQPNDPLAREWTDRLQWEQKADGSWRASDVDAMFIVTALAIRALSARGPDRSMRVVRAAEIGGHSPTARNQAVARGLQFLASRQTFEGGGGVGGGGGWGEDAELTTGIVLLQLGRLATFRSAVRIGDALVVEMAAGTGYVEADAATRWAWRNVHLRCGTALRAKANDAERLDSHDVFPLLANVA